MSWLILYLEGNIVGNSDNDGGGDGIGSDNVYKERAKPMLVLLSNLYSNDEILICDSRPFSCFAYIFY